MSITTRSRRSRVRGDADSKAEVKPWVLHFHASAGYGETFMRFRTRREAREYKEQMAWGGGLVFYPIYREKKACEGQG